MRISRPIRPLMGSKTFVKNTEIDEGIAQDEAAVLNLIDSIMKGVVVPSIPMLRTRLSPFSK